MHTIERAKKTLRSYKSVRQLSLANVSDDYNATCPYFTRSLLWRLQLITNYEVSGPQLASASSPQDHLDVKMDKLRAARREYDLLKRDFPIPWDQLEQENKYFQPSTDQDELDIGTQLKILKKTRVDHDPLSDKASNSRLNDFQTMQAMITDVERLFPQMPRFFINNMQNKRAIVEILFVWWKLHGGNYQQGMHEIAGLVFVELFKEAIDITKISKKRRSSENKVELDDLESLIVEIYDYKQLNADVFHIFSRVIAKPNERYYDETSLLQESIKFNLKLHRCDKYHFILLNNKLKIEPSIWLIRFYRLLLLRELGVDSALPIWDKMISFGYSVKRKEELDVTLLMPYIIIILISMIKYETMQSDYGEVMYLLLHYPVKTRNERTNRSILFSGEVRGSNPDEIDEELHDNNMTYAQEEEVVGDMGGPKIEIDPNGIITDAIIMYNSDPELETVGKMIVDKYYGMYAPRSTERSNSIMSIVRRSSSFSRSRSGSTSSDTREVTTKKTLQTDKSRKKVQEQTRPDNFERTRLEMRLQRKVSNLMKKA